MKLLLTSAGLINESIKTALSELLDRPFAEARAVFVPTAANPERGDKTWLIKDLDHFSQLGWKEVEIIDVAAMADLPKDQWWPVFERADVIFVGGGNTFYLSYWFQKSGLMDALSKLLESKVYVGISAGSMVVSGALKSRTESGLLIDTEYDEKGPRDQASLKTANLVNFVIRPHYMSPSFPKINDTTLLGSVKELGLPVYAIDDQTALKVVDGKVDIVSEGTWRLFGA